MGFTTEEWIYIAIAVVMGIIAIWWNFRDSLQLMRNGREAQGIITNWMVGVRKGRKIFHPMIEFETTRGIKLTFKADESCDDQPKYPVGTVVRIRYAENNPENRRVIYP
jgi:hypothetical protein